MESLTSIGVGFDTIGKTLAKREKYLQEKIVVTKNLLENKQNLFTNFLVCLQERFEKRVITQNI